MDDSSILDPVPHQWVGFAYPLLVLFGPYCGSSVFSIIHFFVLYALISLRVKNLVPPILDLFYQNLPLMPKFTFSLYLPNGSLIFWSPAVGTYGLASVRLFVRLFVRSVEISKTAHRIVLIFGTKL